MWIISSMFLVKNVAKSTYYISKHRFVKTIHMKNLKLSIWNGLSMIENEKQNKKEFSY